MKGTKKQLVDYLYQNFTFKGGMTKKKLETYPIEELEKVVTKNNKEKDYEKYLKELNYPKFFVDVKIDEKLMAYDNLKAKDEKEVKKIIEKDYPNSQIEILKIVNARGYHRCKYCQEITKGSNKDYLCEECHETFGHYLYSEL